MANAVSLLLAYDGVRSLIPIDEWANDWATRIHGKEGVEGGLARGAGMTPNHPRNPIGANAYPGITSRVG